VLDPLRNLTGAHSSLGERALGVLALLPVVGWAGRGIGLAADVARGLSAVSDVAETVATGAARTSRFLSQADLLLPRLGPAYLSHPEEYDAIMQDLETSGVDVQFREGQLAYSAEVGGPGRMILDRDASIGALRHEYRHFLDVRAAGYPGYTYYRGNVLEFWRLEFNAYMEEIRIARQLREFDIGRGILQQMRARRAEIFGE